MSYLVEYKYMLYLSEIEELFKSKEFIKSKALVQSALPHIQILNNPDATPEQKQEAIDNIRALDVKGKSPQETKSIKGKSEQYKDLKSIVQGTKEDLHGLANEKLADATQVHDKRQVKVKKETDEAAAEERAKVRAHERIHGRTAGHSHDVHHDEWEKLNPAAKEYLESKEDPNKKAKREEWNKMNVVLPGSSHTRKELESQAARAVGATKPKPIKERYLSPAQQAKAGKNKDESDINDALDIVHRAHSAGLHDKAIEVMGAIPKEHLPSNMKGYNPLYMHYGVTPNNYAAHSPEEREHIHNFHNEVATGKHDNSPHPGIQKVVQHLKPKVIA